MIKLLTETDKLEKLSSSDIYEGKIKTIYRTYNLNCNFCSFYEQGESGKERNALLISRVDRDFVVKMYSEEDFNAEELAEFFKLSRAAGVFLPPKVMKAIEPYIEGEYLYNDVMEYKRGNNAAEKSGLLNEKPMLDDVFDIIKDEFNISRGLWLTDASHRERHGISRFYIYAGESAAAVLYDDDGTAFITQVSTRKEARRKGLATCMLREIAELHKNSRVVLVCREKTLGFYEKVGFEKIGDTAQIYKFKD